MKRRLRLGFRRQRMLLRVHQAQVVGAASLHEAQVIGVVDDEKAGIASSVQGSNGLIYLTTGATLLPAMMVFTIGFVFGNTPFLVAFLDVLDAQRAIRLCLCLCHSEGCSGKARFSV